MRNQLTSLLLLCSLVMSLSGQARHYTAAVFPSGGATGVIPAKFIAEIERRYNRRFADFVDVFVGTSSGAIAAAWLARENPKPADELVEFYSSVFGNLEKAAGIQSAIANEFKDMNISQATKTLWLLAFDDTAKKTIFFRSDQKNVDVAVSEALCGSCCITPIFKPVKVNCADKKSFTCVDAALTTNGSLAVNDPVEIFINEFSPSMKKDDTLTVLFFSNGYTPLASSSREVANRREINIIEVNVSIDDIVGIVASHPLLPLMDWLNLPPASLIASGFLGVNILKDRADEIIKQESFQSIIAYIDPHDENLRRRIVPKAYNEEEKPPQPDAIPAASHTAAPAPLPEGVEKIEGDQVTLDFGDFKEVVTRQQAQDMGYKI